MQVKICGIRSLEDALYCIKYGANALGFVFHKSSSRYIDSYSVKNIASSLPPFVHKVGLFTNHTYQEINTIMKTAKLSLAQIHTQVSDDFLSKIDYPYIRVARIKTKNDLENIPKNEYILVDSYVDGFGGEGVKISLDIFKNIDCSRFILAGGLTKEYLKQIQDLNFYGIDVSSGVESSKGIKSHQKIKEFLEIAKNITSIN